MENKDNFIEKIKLEIAELKGKFEARRTKENLDDKESEFKEKIQDLEDKLDDLKDQAEDKWEDVKDSISETWTKIKAKFN